MKAGNGKKSKRKNRRRNGIIIAIVIVVICAVAVISGIILSGRGHGLQENTDILNGKISISEEQDGIDQDDENQDDSSSENQDGSGETDMSDFDLEGSDEYLCLVPNTNLVILKISSYDGIFLEDGSDSEISNVAVMLLKNMGKTNVEYADISIECDGQQMSFAASDIPAGAVAAVQEASRAAYREGTYGNCIGQVAELDSFEMSGDSISVVENEDGSLTVTNLTEEEIACVRIFYKYYMEEEDIYVGGITYTAKLTDLGAGEAQTVTPSHYKAGYSKLLMVRTYDTAED